MRRHSGLLLDKFLHGIARGRGGILRVLHIKLLRCASLALLPYYCHLAYLIVIKQLDNKRLLAARPSQHSRLGLVSHHGETNHYTICRM